MMKGNLIQSIRNLVRGPVVKNGNEDNVPGTAPHDPSIFGNHHIAEPHSFAQINPLHFTPKIGMTQKEVWDMAGVMSRRRRLSGTDEYGAGMWGDGIFTGAMKMRDIYEKHIAALRQEIETLKA